MEVVVSIIKKRVILPCTLIAALLIYFYALYHASPLAKDFPVPVSAKLSKSSNDKAFEEYSRSLASEEDGLPAAYLPATLELGENRSDGALTHANQAKIYLYPLNEKILFFIDFTEKVALFSFWGV
ncbi:hypothetical protein [Metabacillus hrfriensis]|uniref:Uncharacterized protein n=1 Tax=Metabacillus hrfriensis TaxID=3048891 RepID=A0ACD4RFK4_9BACI|nr:hypothetical protein [Metabacillus sp. CT-WN-B3]USK30028.1 hypothetical protein LIT32_07970 [Bacillus sp. CMF21]WHZ59272.1 hypothetical protein QLQ22_08085 [Metabacillus sp. CT-WN-B3]